MNFILKPKKKHLAFQLFEHELSTISGGNFEFRIKRTDYHLCMMITILRKILFHIQMSYLDASSLASRRIIFFSHDALVIF